MIILNRAYTILLDLDTIVNQAGII